MKCKSIPCFHNSLPRIVEKRFSDGGDRQQASWSFHFHLVAVIPQTCWPPEYRTGEGLQNCSDGVRSAEHSLSLPVFLGTNSRLAGAGAWGRRWICLSLFFTASVLPWDPAPLSRFVVHLITAALNGHCSVINSPFTNSKNAFFKKKTVSKLSCAISNIVQIDFHFCNGVSPLSPFLHLVPKLGSDLDGTEGLQKGRGIQSILLADENGWILPVNFVLCVFSYIYIYILIPPVLNYFVSLSTSHDVLCTIFYFCIFAFFALTTTYFCFRDKEVKQLGLTRPGFKSPLRPKQSQHDLGSVITSQPSLPQRQWDIDGAVA